MPTKTWASASNSTWNSSGNWSPSGVPGTGDDVVFGDGVNNGNCTVDIAVSVASLTINNTYTGLVDFGTTRTLTTTGDVTIDTGSTGATTTKFSANGLSGGLHYTIGGNLVVSTARKVLWYGTLDITGNATFSGAGDRTFGFSTINCVDYTNSGSSTSQIFGNITATGNFNSSSADAGTIFALVTTLSGTSKTFSAKATQDFSSLVITGSYTFSQASGVGFNAQDFSVGTGGTFTNNVTETDGVILQVVTIDGTYAGSGTQYLGTTGVTGFPCNIDINGTWSNSGTTQVSWDILMSTAATPQAVSGTWNFVKNGDFPGSDVSVAQTLSGQFRFTGNVSFDCDDANTYALTIASLTGTEFQSALTTSNTGGGTFTYLPLSVLSFTTNTANISLLDKSYGAMTFSGGTKTLTGSGFTSSTLTVSGGTLNANNKALTTLGNFVISGTAVFQGGNQTHTIGGNCVFSGTGTSTFSTCTINLSGDWDLSAMGVTCNMTFTSMTLNLNGTAKQFLAAAITGFTIGTINVNGTYTIPLNTSFRGMRGGTSGINIKSGGTLTNNETSTSGGVVVTGSILVVESGGTYAGTGNLTCINGAITHSGGTWSNTGTNTIGWNHTLTGGTCNFTGTWNFSKSGGTAGGGSSRTQTLTGTAFTFTGPVTFNCDEAATYIVTNSNVNLNFSNNIVFSNSGSGTFTYNKGSGTITLNASSGSVNAGFFDRSIEPLVVSCSGATTTFVGGFTTTSYTHSAGNVAGGAVNIIVNGDTTITSTGTVSLTSGGSWASTGSWDSSSATAISAAAWIFTFTGTSKTINTSNTGTGLGIVTFDTGSTYSVGSGGLNCAGIVLVGTLNISTNSVACKGQFNLAGTISGSGAFTVTNGTITNDGTWSHTGTLNVNQSCTMTSSSSTSTIPCTVNFNQSSGTPTLVFSKDHTFTGDVTFSQDVVANYTVNFASKAMNFNKNLTFSALTPSNLIISNPGTTTLGGSSGSHTIALIDKTIGDLVINASGATKTFSSGFTCANLTASAGNVTFSDIAVNAAILTLSTVGTVDLGSGDFFVTTWNSSSVGTLTVGTSTVTVTGGTLTTSSTSLGAVTIAGVSLVSSTANVGNLTLSGSLNLGGTLTTSGSTVTLGGSISDVGTLNITNGPAIAFNTSMASTLTLLIDQGGTVTTSGSTITFDCPTTFRKQSGAHTLTFSKNVLFNDDVTFTQNATGTTFTIQPSNKNLTFKKDVTLVETDADGLVWTKGSGTITLSGSSTQNINFLGKTVEDIVSTGSDVVLVDDLVCDTLSLNSGGFDFGGKNVTTTGDLTILSVDLTGLGDSIITVGGDFSADGTVSSLLDLNPDSVWELNVTGSGHVTYASVKNSDASGSSDAIRTTNCVDEGDNINWRFKLLVESLDVEQNVDPVPGVELRVNLEDVAGTTDLLFYGKHLDDDSYVLLGTVSISTDRIVTFVWKDLLQGQFYQWYAIATDVQTDVQVFYTSSPPLAADGGFVCKLDNGQRIRTHSQYVCPANADSCSGSALVAASTVCDQRL